ncbi:MAG TPA: ATP-binding protein, partial [Acetobacteraceae bacterium]
MDQRLTEYLERIAAALERLAPSPAPPPDLDAAEAFVWHPGPPRLAPVDQVSRVEIGLLKGVERQKQILLDNTRRFARGLPANNAMLWGARGMGKSSLVKAVHAVANQEMPGSLALVEIHREDVRSLPELLNALRGRPRRCLILCDDLSFEREDSDYKALKSILEGGIEGRPANVLFYATSNRRHLMPRDMIENERSTAINPSESTEEKVSLSDRFGLWIGFHNCDQETYFAMVEGYAASMSLPITTAELRA